MSKIKLDLKGKKMGRLTPIQEAGSTKDKKIKWLCLCDCGNTVVVIGKELKSGGTKSCGCLRREVCKLNAVIIHGDAVGGKITPEYLAWINMKCRCYDENDDSYKNYGERGIIVCDRWLNSYKNFLEDMGRRPSNLHSLERKDNDGIYEPSNCKWATQGVQSRNRRTNVWLEHDGQRMILLDWAHKWGIKYQVIERMLKKKAFAEICGFYEKKAA